MRRRMNINYNKLCLLIIACTVSIVKFINDRMFNTRVNENYHFPG